MSKTTFKKFDTEYKRFIEYENRGLITKSKKVIIGSRFTNDSGNNKLGATSTSIPCFPPELTSQLQSIFLSHLCYAKDRNYCSHEEIYKILISELHELRREGVIINAKGKQYRIYFQLGLILGDNLGLNQILGFVSNFGSGKACRIYRASSHQIKTLTSEQSNLLRTIENYEKDCTEKNQQESGILRKCIFLELDDFRVTENITLDMIHDIFEGVANDTMVNILNDLIYHVKAFTLEFLNTRLENFEYGFLESSNKIPNIKKEHITTKKKLKMSAAEMICLTRYFGLIIGDKVKEDENDVWYLYILLRKIVSYLLSPRMAPGFSIRLQYLIDEFLKLYTKLYGDLKFKFHNLIHLVRVLELNGPLIYYWGMRYESKHHQLKLSSVVTSNKINLLETICIRSQLNLAYLKFNKISLFNELSYNTSQQIDEEIRSKYFSSSAKDYIVSTPYVKVKEKEFKIDMIVVVEIGQGDSIIFGKIKNIYIKNKEVFLLLQPFASTGFDEHYFAYTVDEIETCIFKNVDQLPNIHPCLCIKNNNNLFIATKYIL